MFKKSFLKVAAKKERVSLSFLEKQLACGRVVIPLNKKRTEVRPCAIGEGLKVKINTNIGLSSKTSSLAAEAKKAVYAVKYGADTIMDLSVAGKLKSLRRQLLNKLAVPLGTVPLYEAGLLAEKKKGSFEQIDFDCFWEVLKQQAEDGVDFFTIHAGITKSIVSRLRKKKRVGGIVSRGGAMLARWMIKNNKENPLYTNFDRILELAKNYRITLSLGDALRPGAIADSSDFAQFKELKILGQLVKRCRKSGVQVMVEGPGHIRLDEIALNMIIEKKLCHQAPFYVLGPIPTDIACGYDHITSAIGGAIAAFYGADFLCVVTPAEHLRLPSQEDIREGTISAKIAAHCVNVLRFKDEWKKDQTLSLHRSRRRWDEIFALSLDQKKARQYRMSGKSAKDLCTMCGSFCSLKMIENCDLLKRG